MSNPAPARSYWDRYEAQPWKAKIDGLYAYDAQGQPVMEEYDSEQKDAQGKVMASERRRRHALEEIHFRETGDAGALIDIVFGAATGADKNQAIASLVISSVVAPAISAIQFNSLALQVKFALFNEIMTHVKRDQAPDFSVGSPTGETPGKEPSTPVGGSGALPKSSALVTPLDS